MDDCTVGTLTTQDVLALLGRHRRAGLEEDREKDMLRGWPEEPMQGRIPKVIGEDGVGKYTAMNTSYPHLPRDVRGMPRNNGISPAGKARIAAAQKLRWERYRLAKAQLAGVTSADADVAVESTKTPVADTSAG